jgi:hypothetical protein
MSDGLFFAIELHIEEKAPRINVHCKTKAEEARLASWIQSQPKLVDLINRAIGIRGEEEQEDGVA